MSCLTQCVKKYSCKATPDNVTSGHTLGPYVKVRFVGGASEITVGNQTSTPNNTAMIKSFEYGTTNGQAFRIEIVDIEGGEFHKFADRLAKNIKNASSDYAMEAEFGWIKANCDGTVSLNKSPRLRSFPMQMEVEFSEGIIRYIISATDLLQMVFVSRKDTTYGTDDNKMSLKDAIRQLFSEEEPSIQVEFLRKKPNSKGGSIATEEYGFKDFGKDGPKSVWDSDGQNKLSVAQKWLEPFRTDRDKGIHPTWDNTASKPTIIFWEDVMTDDERGPACGLSLGSYIINGGNCSPVVKFSPKINWPAAFAKLAGPTGNSGGAASGKTIEKTKELDVQNRDAGIAQSVPITRQAWDAYGPDESGDETEKSQNVNEKANSVNTPGLAAIEAELTIQGDPRPQFVNIRQIYAQALSLAIINPFYIRTGSSSTCGSWLAEPPCNEVLSNRFWMIKGVNHQIKEGSYVTTFNLFLAVPGIDLPEGQNVGGDPLGWKPGNIS